MIESVIQDSAAPVKLQLPRRAEARLWSKIYKRHPDECWLWTAGIDGDGYGQFHLFGKNNRAHRIVFQIAVHLLSPDECALHNCDTPRCCNPRHLFAGSKADNSADMMKKRRGRFISGDDHYSRRLPETVRRGEAHHSAKLAAADVLEIRRLHAAGVKQRDIMKQFCVSRAQVSSIVLRRTWAHVS